MSLVLAVTPAEAKEVDLTARDALDQLREDLSRRGIVFAVEQCQQGRKLATGANPSAAKCHSGATTSAKAPTRWC